MKTAIQFRNEMTSLLTNAFSIIDNYHQAQRNLNSFVGREIVSARIYKGSSVRKILITYFDNLAKKATNRFKATGRAKFNGDELLEVCIGHININMHDCERQEQHTVESLTNDCKFEELVTFIDKKQALLGDEGLRLAADNIVRFFELANGRSISGKGIARVALHFHLFSHICYSDKTKVARELYAIAEDLRVMCKSAGINDLANNFHVLGNDFYYGPYDSRIASGTKYDTCSGLITIYKHHIKFTLTHQDFDALLAFVVTYKSNDVTLGEAVTSLAIAA